jgi:hypothetical protein
MAHYWAGARRLRSIGLEEYGFHFKALISGRRHWNRVRCHNFWNYFITKDGATITARYSCCPFRQSLDNAVWCPQFWHISCEMWGLHSHCLSRSSSSGMRRPIVKLVFSCTISCRCIALLTIATRCWRMRHFSALSSHLGRKKTRRLHKCKFIPSRTLHLWRRLILSR